MRMLCLVLSACALCSSVAATTPQRVMSISLCTDQLAVSLANPGQLQSVTWIAQQSAQSLVKDRVQDLQRNYARIEEIVAFQPDLVLASAFSNPYLLQQITRLNIPLHVMPMAQSVADLKANIVNLSAALGVDSQRQLQRLASHLAQIEKRDASDQRALVIQAGGWTASSPSLIDEFISLLGMNNLAEEAGIQGWGQMDIEAILRLAPDWLFIISSDAEHKSFSLKDQYLQHPALHDAPFKVLSLPSASFGCGHFSLLDLVDDTVRKIALEVKDVRK